MNVCFIVFVLNACYLHAMPEISTPAGCWDSSVISQKVPADNVVEICLDTCHC